MPNHRQHSQESRLTGGGYHGDTTSSGSRFPRAIVRYRLPMSVVFNQRGPQFPPRARYFLFIGRLIACHPPIASPVARSRGTREQSEPAGSNCLHCADLR